MKTDTGKQIQLSNLELQRAHSPEYYKNRNQADDLRLSAEIYGRDSREFQDMLKRQRETQPDYKSHADKLAEALRISTTTLETVYGNDRTNIAAKCCIERNKAALAAYEAAQ